MNDDIDGQRDVDNKCIIISKILNKHSENEKKEILINF